VGLVVLGVATLMTPALTARTGFLLHPQQSGMASSPVPLRGLTGLAGVTCGIKSSTDVYAATMQSVTATDRLSDQFNLRQVYESKYRFEAGKGIERKTRIAIGKKDGLISVNADDTDPKRTADLASAYVEEPRRMTWVLTVSQAQQPREFFERELKDVRDQLDKAQQVLQPVASMSAHFAPNPGAAAENNARLKAETPPPNCARRSSATPWPTMHPKCSASWRNLARCATSWRGLSKPSMPASGRTTSIGTVSSSTVKSCSSSLCGSFRLHVDESREGALIQMVTVAMPLEYKIKPKRTLIATAATMLSLLLMGVCILEHHFWRESAKDPDRAEKVARLRAAFGRQYA